jgi:hypothetical protein
MTFSLGIADKLPGYKGKVARVPTLILGDP